MSENVRNKLSAKQLKAIELLAQMPRKYRSQQELAVMLGINTRTLRRWKHQTAFQDRLKQRIQDNYGEYDGIIKQIIVKKACEGNVSMIRFYYEHAESWKPNQKPKPVFSGRHFSLTRVSDTCICNIKKGL